jgi:hypothetical protein
MGTPSGIRLHPFDLSAGVSHDTHEQAAPEQHPTERDNESFHSPYVPAGSRERASAHGHSVENDHDPLQSPYAPKKVCAAVEPDFAISEDVATLASLRVPEGLCGDPERRAVDVHKPHDAADGLRAPGPLSDKQKQEQPSAVRYDEIVRDLERLIASVRWVQRAEAAVRLPRAPQLAPVPGLAPVDARDRGCGGEMFDNWAPRSLEPERLVPPSAVRLRRDNLLGLLIILIVSVLAAPIAYYVSVGRGGSISKPPLRPQMAAFDSKFISPPSTSSVQEDSPMIIVRDDVLKARAEGEIPSESERPKSSPTASSFGSETVAMLQPGTPSAQAPPSGKAIRVLDPEEIELLMKKGEQFLAAGDVVAARIALQRAAQAGDGNAAVVLGATYDPTELAKLGVVGISADVAKARSWYEKAEKFGSPEARRRLDLLAGR